MTATRVHRRAFGAKEWGSLAQQLSALAGSLGDVSDRLSAAAAAAAAAAAQQQQQLAAAPPAVAGPTVAAAKPVRA
jgi:hypothetical protein